MSSQPDQPDQQVQPGQHGQHRQQEDHGTVLSDHPEAPFHDEHGDREVAPIRPLNRPKPIDAICAIVIAGSLHFAGYVLQENG